MLDSKWQVIVYEHGVAGVDLNVLNGGSKVGFCCPHDQIESFLFGEREREMFIAPWDDLGLAFGFSKT